MSDRDTYRSHGQTRNANYRPTQGGGRAPRGRDPIGRRGLPARTARPPATYGNTATHHTPRGHATAHGTRHTAHAPGAPHPPRLPPACTNTKRVPWRGSTTTYPYVLPRGAAAEPWSMSKAVTTRQGRSPYRRVAAHRQAPQPRPETANNRAQVYCFWCASFGRRMLPRRARAHHDHACE